MHVPILPPEYTAESPLIAFSQIWHALGPFQIGTREATWGADPIGMYGGFSQVYPSDPRQGAFQSSLGRQGQAGWSKVAAQTIPSDSIGDVSEKQRGATAAIKLTLGFPEIDWKTLQEFYGWPALQWQAWLRGTLKVHGSDPVIVKIYMPSILEFEVDGQRYFGGDFFSYKAAPLILHLHPGPHTVNIRVIRDLRVSGGLGEPSAELEIYAVPTVAGLDLAQPDALISDFIEGSGFASTICCIPAHNTGSLWLDIVGVKASSHDKTREFVLIDGPISMAPGQTKAITFGFRIADPLNSETALLSFNYVWRGSGDLLETDTFLFEPVRRESSELHKMVFRRSNGTVSYALLQTPCPTGIVEEEDTTTFPVLAILHGAGVEAESAQTRDMVKEIGDVPAWIVVPTGSTRWSGDDWHTWGLADVEAAIAAIPEYIRNIHREQPKADIKRIYVAGHSNGGQGVWHMVTHRPDRIRAAAAVSGYLSIQKYVPYTMWNEVDPKISGIIQASLSSYRHEILVNNNTGIPILQQHGDKDDNVPVFHSRRMNQLLNNNGSVPEYSELPGKSHWDNETMATPFLKSFYSKLGQWPKGQDRPPRIFSIVLPSTGEQIGSRKGIVVDQLLLLGQLGRMDIECQPQHTWDIKTSNIARFHLGSEDYSGSSPERIRLDGEMFELGDVSAVHPVGFLLESGSRWIRVPGSGWESCAERSGSQYGTINAILHTRSQLQIRYQPETAFSIALQTSRNLYQYYLANCNLCPGDHFTEADGNEIVIGIGSPRTSDGQRIFAEMPDYPIRIDDHGITIQTSRLKRAFPNSLGLGVIYLALRTEGRLQLIIWGYDIQGAQQAARLIPGLTGVGQPDFVIVGNECSWRGAGGVLAMGFLERDWTISETAYIS